MNLITDRTKSDVLLGTEKGRYGITDLNRVEAAVAELYGLAKDEGLDVGEKPVIKTDWALPEVFSHKTWVTHGQMLRYLGNVNRLCRAVELAADLPGSMDQLTWEGANQIEKALELIEKRIPIVRNAFRFSGEFFAGEENNL